MAANKKYGLLITGDSRSAVKALKLTDAQLKQLNVRQRRTSTQADRTKKALLGYAKVLGVAGLGAALISTVKSAAAFEKKIAEISTLLDDTSSLDEITQSIKDMAIQFGGDVITNSEAMYSIISAGAASAAEATNTLTVANKLAIGGVTDVATAADGLTSIMNAYGESAGTATNISDAMFAAMKAGKTTIGELSASIGGVAPLAAQTGVSLKELLAATATLTKGGVSTSEAMTGLQGVLAAVIKVTPKAAKTAKELGIEFNLASLKAKGLAGFIDHVREKTDGNAEAMAALFGRVEGLTKVMALAGSQSEDYAEVLDKVTNSAGQTEIAVDKMMKTFDFQYDVLIANLKDVGIAIGDGIAPSATKALTELNLLFELFRTEASTVETASGYFNTIGKGLEEFASRLGLIGEPVELFAKGLQLVTTSSKETTDNLRLLDKQLNDAELSFDKAKTAAEHLDDQFSKAVKSIDDLGEFEKKLGDATEKTTTGLDKQSKATKDKSKVTQAINKDLDAFFAKELRNSKATSDYTKDMEDQIRVLQIRTTEGDAAADVEEEWIRVQESGIDVTREQVIAYQEQIGSLQDLVDATEDSANQYEEIWSNTIENMQKAFGDLIYENLQSMIDDGELSFKKFTDTLKSLFLRMLADMVAALLAKQFAKLFGSAFGGVFGGSSGGGGVGGIITSGVSSAVSNGIMQGAGGSSVLKGIFGSPASTSSGSGGTGVISGGAYAAQQSGVLAAPEIASAAEVAELTAQWNQGAKAVQTYNQASNAATASQAAQTVAAGAFVAAIAGIAIMGAVSARARDKENAAYTDQFNILRTQTDEFAGELLTVNDNLAIVGQTADAMYISITGTQEERTAQLQTWHQSVIDAGSEIRQIYTSADQTIAMVTGNLAEASELIASGFDQAKLQFSSFQGNMASGMTTITAQVMGDTALWADYLQGAMDSGKVSAGATFSFIKDASGQTSLSLKGDANEWTDFLAAESRIAADAVTDTFGLIQDDGTAMFEALNSQASSFSSALASLRAPSFNPDFGEATVQGFSTGGSLRVGGYGGSDSQFVGLMATPGETITVRTPEQQRLDGSHLGGLDYVPFDGYIAELHRGEKITPARENDLGSTAAIVEEIRQLRQEQALDREQSRSLLNDLVALNGEQLHAQEMSARSLDQGNSRASARGRR
jgi:TP901 family phage tail tape measure protein